MRPEAGMLLVILGVVIGMYLAIYADDAEFKHHVKAGVFEDSGIAYHIEAIPK